MKFIHQSNPDLVPYRRIVCFEAKTLYVYAVGVFGVIDTCWNLMGPPLRWEEPRFFDEVRPRPMEDEI